MAYRMVIKLKLTQANEQMLVLISKVIGGTVRKDGEGFIVWVTNAKEDAIRLLLVFDKYPPLTTKMGLQVKYMKECINHGSVEKYLATRDKKYEGLEAMGDRQLAQVVGGEYKEPRY